MVITTPHVVKSILDLKPYNRLFKATKSDVTITVQEKGVRDSWSKKFLDVECMQRRIAIGRTRTNALQIDDRKVSRLHAVIECSLDGVWSFTDVQSLNGSTVNGEALPPKTAHLLKDGDEICIGKIRWHLCHKLKIRLHYVADDLPKEEKPPPPRKLTWRRSLYCNGCMGYGPRHSCTMRVSVLRRLIVDANRKSNVYAVRPGKTLLQKAVMKRMSFWWPKKESEYATAEKLVVPRRYEPDSGGLVRRLPDFDDTAPPSPVQYPVFTSSLSI
ncbi:hypothetical protein MPTK1_3g09870 [Marchantia polymorpha subsp. ruderalis]|uniref:FHA domain-containing protein n=2 Tax=Marchantia polymorpha TaxID=3197 RepID=A0AAF6AZ69_MARPO|nr:hypothetical protein MARPO_0085s0039 [Marchantia polymorpha]BBN05053.1 hypothetical protein Mp_3g09870 [Marchantia polymorpha subsp. ruderalis]|eukprot:PTQ33820.1 hypothetical protein MARPO_0085s0039 [Marchantia polymorpha]